MSISIYMYISIYNPVCDVPISFWKTISMLEKAGYNIGGDTSANFVTFSVMEHAILKAKSSPPQVAGTFLPSFLRRASFLYSSPYKDVFLYLSIQHTLFAILFHFYVSFPYYRPFLIGCTLLHVIPTLSPLSFSSGFSIPVPKFKKNEPLSAFSLDKQELSLPCITGACRISYPPLRVFTLQEVATNSKSGNNLSSSGSSSSGDVWIRQQIDRYTDEYLQSAVSWDDNKKKVIFLDCIQLL